jgi:transposase
MNCSKPKGSTSSPKPPAGSSTAKKMGRPSLTPGICFRALLVGYFEGIDSERGIAWRATDSLGVRHFLGIGLDERSPDHSTLSRTRRLIAVETHEQVFGFVLRIVIFPCPLKGPGTAEGQDHRRGRHDPRSQRGDAEHCSPGHRRQLPGVPDRIGPQVLTKESGIETPTREQLSQLDRKRRKRTSNEDWEHPHDRSACMTKMRRLPR